MAPEQHAGGNLDARSDQFAFCVALYEGLYGQRAFEGDDAEALARAKTSGPPRLPRDSGTPGLFAAIALTCLRELGLGEAVVNVEGGAIAHGHPIGATGAVLTTRLLYAMKRDGLKRGVVTLCIGGGQGIALALEAL